MMCPMKHPNYSEDEDDARFPHFEETMIVQDEDLDLIAKHLPPFCMVVQ